jgi:hypothetical protein
MTAGDVQWMTAGSGILHQEMPKGDAQGRMHGFQLWANLPSSLKMTDPRYQDIPASAIPEVTDDDGTHVRVSSAASSGARRVRWRAWPRIRITSISQLRRASASDSRWRRRATPSPMCLRVPAHSGTRGPRRAREISGRWLCRRLRRCWRCRRRRGCRAICRPGWPSSMALRMAAPASTSPR